MEDEIRDERLLERRREALDELRRQSPDESDGVGHEVALAVVLERAGRRVERLEQAIVDGCVRSGERVQERRLPDVRVAGERDGRTRLRRTRSFRRVDALALERRGVASSGATHACVRAGGRSRAGSRPGPRVPTPPPSRSRCCHMPRMRGRLYSSCASSTWSFPSELRACCAKMSRISCVRSTTRVFSASSSVRCCVGLSSSSTSSTSAAASANDCFSSASFPFPTNVRGSGCARCWTSSPTRLDARGARQLRQLAELELAVRALRVDADEEPALRLRPWCGIGLARSHCEIMPRYAPRGDRARRPPRRADARARRHPLRERQRGRRSASTCSSLVPPSWAPEYAGDEAFLFVVAAASRRPARRARRALRHRPGAGQPSGPNRRRRGARARRERHEGRPRRRDRARTRRRPRERRPATSRLLLFGREELPAEHNPLPALFAASTCRPRDDARNRPRADRPRDPVGLPRERRRAPHVPRDERPLGAAVARRQRARARRARPRAAVRARASGGGRRRTRVPRGRRPSHVSTPGSPTTSSPARRRRRSTSATRRTASRPRPRRTSPSSSPTARRLEIVSNALACARRHRLDLPCERFRQPAALAIQPKQAWTNVADFTTRGSRRGQLRPGSHGARAPPATSASPSRRSSRAYEVLHRFVTSPIGEDAA